MYKIVVMCALLVTLGGLLIKSVEAQVPPIPSFLGGQVIVTGKAMVTGYSLTARVGAYETEGVLVKNNFFNLVVAPRESKDIGKPISFWLGGNVESTGVMIYEEKVSVQGSLVTLKYGPINDLSNDGLVDSSDVIVKVNGTVVEVRDVNSRSRVVTLENAPSMGSAVYVEYSAKQMSFNTGIVNMNVGILFPALPEPTPTPTTIPPIPTATAVPAPPTRVPTSTAVPTPTLTSIPATATPVAGIVVFSGVIAAPGVVTIPEDSTLVAKIGDYVSSPAVIQGNQYTNLVVAPRRSELVGENIEFILNGVNARRTEIYRSSGIVDGFDLVFIGLPTPTLSPVPTETSTPVPPPVATATPMVIPPTSTATLVPPTSVPQPTPSPAPTIGPTATYSPTSTPIPPTVTTVPIIPTIPPITEASGLQETPNESDGNSVKWIVVLVVAGILIIGAIAMFVRSKRKAN
jgi:hypothetical protein